MNALTFLNNFERELGRPLFKNNWLDDLAEARAYHTFSSSFTYDDKKAIWNLTVELPGVTKEHVKVDTHDGYIELSGEKTKGFNLGKFEGRYRLPEGVDTEKIAATFEDGVLNIEIPMTEKKASKTVQIK